MLDDFNNLTSMLTVKLQLSIAEVIRKREELNAEMGYLNRVLAVLYAELSERKENTHNCEEENNGQS